MNQHPSSRRPIRRIHLDGPVNFRDLGGYATLDGRIVRWRELYRSDALHEMSRRDGRTVFGTLDVRAVIDLRSRREIHLVGLGPVAACGARWHHISVIEEPPATSDSTPDPTVAVMENVSMADRYLGILEHAGPHFVNALTVIAASDGPVVFHCTAGKDRTGLLAAFLLSVLGVDDDDIASDYALTEHVMDVLATRYLGRATDPRFADQPESQPGWADGARQLMTADPATITTVLGELRANSGSVEAWLREKGLESRTVLGLRDRYLDV